MENYSYNSYPDSSHDSSPRSREIDCDQNNASWDEPSPPPPPPPSNYKVKFMCSYGGKIHPRPHDNQLAYVGGDTKILSVDRNIRFSGIISKLSALCDFDVCFKYQLPGEDLDALISVTNEEDLEHMMIEYDRLHRASAKPARLRLFLFPFINPSSSSPTTSSLSDNESSSKSNQQQQQWFVDALNSVPISLDSSSSSPPPTTQQHNPPDFLFGFDKNNKPSPPPPPPPPIKQPELVQESSSEPIPVKIPTGKEDRYIIGGGGEQAAAAAVSSSAEIQRQIQELQRLQMANHEQAMFQRKTDEMLARAFPGDYYVQKVPSPTNVPVTPAPRVHSPSPSPATMSVPTGYWQQQQQQQQDNRHVVTGGGGGGYPAAPAPAQAPPHTGSDQPVYIIPAPGPLPPNMYHPQMSQIPFHQQQHHQQSRPMTGQGYYGMQRMVPEHVYREQPVYGHNMVPAPPPQQPTKLMGSGQGGGYGAPVPASGIPVAETGYAQVAYDSAGRQVYYTTSAPGGVVMPPPPPLPPTTATYHQTSVAPAAPPTIVMDGRQQEGGGGGGGGGAKNKVMKQSPAASPV